ncbi:MAG: hypothetical protein V1772_02635, partial [Chloroflexota bacterium]
ATTPAKGDWGGIVFEDSSSDESYLRGFAIRYGGTPRPGSNNGAILLKNASPYLAEGAFSDNYLNGIEIPRATWLTDRWDAQGIVYHVMGDVTVARTNTLALPPGAVVKFDAGRLLTVQGTFVAEGSALRPVVLTSIRDDSAGGDTNGDGAATTPKAKDWVGILFDVLSRGNPGAIGYAEVRYAGSSAARMAPIEMDNASPRLHHITFVDNYRNGAQLTALGDALGTLTLTSTDVPYVIDADLTVPRAETLTLRPGVTVKFATNRSLLVEGVLDARGAISQPVLFTSLKDDAAVNDTDNTPTYEPPAHGDWGCVYFAPGSDDARNTVEWATLRYAGSDTLFGSRIGAIRLNNASPRLGNISFANNWINALEIPTGDLETDTWDNTSVIYFITGNLRIPVGQALTIQPGIVVKVLNVAVPNSPPKITITGTLRVGDLTGAAVTLTSGRDDTAGPPEADNWDSNDDGSASAPGTTNWDWIGIAFAATADTASSYLHNTIIRYAGSRQGLFSTAHGALRVEGGSLPVVGCQFLTNYRGIEALNGATPQISASRFEGNTDYGVFNGAPGGSPVVATNCWWGAVNGPRSDVPACHTATGDGDRVSGGVAFSPPKAVWP